MEILVTAIQVTLTEAERLRLREISERVQRYYPRVLTLRWTFREIAGTFLASCAIHATSGRYHAHARAERAGAAMDLAFDKVVRQRRRERAIRVTGRAKVGKEAKHTLH